MFPFLAFLLQNAPYLPMVFKKNHKRVAVGFNAMFTFDQKDDFWPWRGRPLEDVPIPV